MRIIHSFFLSFIIFLILGMGVIYAIQTGRFEYIFWSLIAAAVVFWIFKPRR